MKSPDSCELEIQTGTKQRVFKLVSLLLQYPTGDWIDPHELAVEVDSLESMKAAGHLRPFLDYLNAHSLEELAVNYVNTFDFDKNISLYLTYSETQEDRGRGRHLIGLKELYAHFGLQPVSNELPDYLPLFLEFVSAVPEELAKMALNEFKEKIQRLHADLRKMSSPYADVIQACLTAMQEFK